MNNINILNDSKAVKGVYYCNQDRTDELNNRIFERNIPSRQFQHQFSNRPVSTKFEQFQTISKNNSLNNTDEKILKKTVYNIKNDFNPGTTAPPQGYSNNIDDESRLNRQFFADQNNYQSKWIPSTNSSLYKTDKICWEENQPYPRLFLDYGNLPLSNQIDTSDNIVQKLKTYNKLENYNVGKNLWQNSTRQQLKNIK